MAPFVNDSLRLDETEAICLSIGFPNYKMFYRLRMQSPDADWAIVVILASVLLEKQCAFCRENAARSTVTSIPLRDRMSSAALEGMFEDFDTVMRADLGLADSLPTNPQAEVLVLENIEPRYIRGVLFDKRSLKDEWSSSFPHIEFRHRSDYFSYRKDFSYWKVNFDG